MHPLPTLKQLQYLAALADHGSFSDAAIACNVTQSTLSAGIAVLEDLLGQSLADRSQRQIRLTSFGEETVDRARSLLSGAADLVARARSLSAPLTGPVRIGVIPTIAPYLLPRILPGLQARFPKLEMQWREDLSDRLVDLTRTGRLDLILMAFPFDTGDLEQHTLFDEPFLLARARTKGAKPKSVSPADLENERLLLLEEGHCLRSHALAACQLQSRRDGGRRDREAFSATSLPTLIQMVAQDYGVTLLPAMAASALPANIETVPLRGPSPSRAIGLAWRKSNPRARDFQLLGKEVRAILKA